MPNFNVPTIRTGPNADRRAVRAWLRISDRPVSITVTRAGVQLAAQTVRVEPSAGGSTVNGPVGEFGTGGVTVFGVIGHPSGSLTVPDTNLQRGDRFLYNGDMVIVDAVILEPGELQAFGNIES